MKYFKQRLGKSYQSICHNSRLWEFFLWCILNNCVHNIECVTDYLLVFTWLGQGLPRFNLLWCQRLNVQCFQVLCSNTMYGIPPALSDRLLDLNHIKILFLTRQYGMSNTSAPTFLSVKFTTKLYSFVWPNQHYDVYAKTIKKSKRI